MLNDFVHRWWISACDSGRDPEGRRRMHARAAQILAGEPALRALADRGRAVHAEWCERVFAPTLAGLQGADRARRLAQLIAVTTC